MELSEECQGLFHVPPIVPHTLLELTKGISMFFIANSGNFFITYFYEFYSGIASLIMFPFIYDFQYKELENFFWTILILT